MHDKSEGRRKAYGERLSNAIVNADVWHVSLSVADIH
jgi:hypothetical protein